MSVKKTYFDTIASFRKKRKINAYYWNEITQYIRYFAHEDSSVLEIGCGSGDLLIGIPACRKVGIDFSEVFIEWAKDKHSDANIEFIVMDANEISLNEQFDLIIISNLIGYVDDIQHVLNEVKKCCHPNTKVIVQYYNSIWEPLIKLAEILGLKKPSLLQNWLGIKDINNLLYISGFEVYRNTKRMLCPVYIPLFSFILNNYLAKFIFFKFFGLNIYSFAKPTAVTDAGIYAKKYTTTVVIPAKNESGNIEDAIIRMPDFGKHVEIIFMEGNSSDDSWEKILEIQKKYAATHDIVIGRQKGKGKGDAVQEAFKIAKGDILMILDADLTVPPEDLPKFYEAIASGKGDFINGTRLVYPMEKDAMRFLNYLGNHFFSKVFTWLLDQRFKDTLCGTKVMFRKDYLKLTKNRTYFGNFDPFGDFDLIFGAHKLNLKIVEVPIRYRERKYGTTNISRYKHGLILLRMCIFASRKCKFI
jgi:SAM-dependent methyltransferase